jgi:hypothetical protein
MLGLILIFSSCSKKATPCGDPAPTFIQIGLVDNNDSLVIGKKYDPDSIKLNVDGKNVNVYFSKGYMIINYDGYDIYNNMNYLLYLSKTDVDTLTLKVHRYESECWSYYDEFGGLTYNSKIISPVSYNKFEFKIIKE